MSVRPFRLCVCGALVALGERCAICERERDLIRGNAQERGYGARHRRWATMVLARHPQCCGCGAPPQPGDQADHINPLPQPNWWDGDWSLENGQRLCRTCHNRKTAKEHPRVA